MDKLPKQPKKNTWLVNDPRSIYKNYLIVD